MTLDVDVTFHSIRMDGKKGGTDHSATLFCRHERLAWRKSYGVTASFTVLPTFFAP